LRKTNENYRIYIYMIFAMRISLQVDVVFIDKLGAALANFIGAPLLKDADQPNIPNMQ